jgi:very-short-patch-repair endonuclease
MNRQFFPPLPPGEDRGEGMVNPTTDRSRTLRRNSTWAEKTLWRHLRNRKLLGCKFRRQHPAGPYYLDFFCLEANFAIEADGGGHGFPEQRQADQKREQYLKAKGVHVVRVWNNQLRENIDGVLYRIKTELQSRLTELSLTPALSQRERESDSSSSPSGRGSR